MEHDLDFTLIEHSNFTQVDFQDGIHPTIDGGVPLLVRNIKQKLNPILGIELNGEYKRRNFTQNRFQEFRSRDNETQRFRPLGNPRYNDRDRYDYFKSDDRTFQSPCKKKVSAYDSSRYQTGPSYYREKNYCDTKQFNSPYYENYT